MSAIALVLWIVAPAALASPVGGLVALWKRPTTLFLSISVGFAGGVLLGTFAFEMLPKALELSSLPLAIGGFVAGFAAVYGFDLFIYRGRLAGEQAEQHARTERFHRHHPPLGTETTVLAGGTSAEELIEGASIGVSLAIEPTVGVIVALAVCIDNFSEALSIGELLQNDERRGDGPLWKKIIGWTSLIGASLLASSLLGWFLLRDISESALGALLAMGAGGMFYLTVTDLLPEAEKRQYQQSGGIATAVGFMTIFALAEMT